MKYFLFLILLSGFAFGAPAPQVSHSALLEKAIRLRHPEISRLEISHVRLRKPVGKSPRVTWMSNNRFGWVQFEMEWEEEGSLLRSSGTATVEAYGDVAVAAVPIDSQETLSKDNVRFEERKLSALMAGGYYLDLSTLQGYVARTSLRPGKVISPSNVQRPYLIQRGQVVELIHRSGPLQVTARVEALQRGRLNDWIRVKNTNSQKVIRARVFENGIVRMK